VNPSKVNPSKKTILGHVHIERTGGTTLSQILRRIFPLAYGQALSFSTRGQGIFKCNDFRILSRINPRIQCIGGHPLKPYIDLSKCANVKYVTVLRNPLSRYISHHLYWVEKMKWDHTFKHFMTREDVFNYQTRTVAGQEDLSLAKNILKEKFICVGIIEEFDAFLTLLGRKLFGPQHSNLRYSILNVGKKESSHRERILDNMEKYRKEIIDKNYLDIQLYEYVKHELIPNQRRECLSTNDNRYFRMISPNISALAIVWYLEKLFSKFYYVPVSRFIKRCHAKS